MGNTFTLDFSKMIVSLFSPRKTIWPSSIVTKKKLFCEQTKNTYILFKSYDIKYQTIVVSFFISGFKMLHFYDLEV